jgi:hypothetical protein
VKFTVTMKDPDGLHTSLEDAVFGAMPEGLPKEEQEMLMESRREKARKFAGKWLEYGEYVELEFDTEAGTCVVVEPE